MKPKSLVFPLLVLTLSPAVTAGQFVWTGNVDSDWTTPANWDITSSVPVSPDTYPIPGSTYASDFLNFRNNGDLTTSLGGITPGADAVYNPGPGVTTTFNGGRCFVIGTGTGPTATLPSLPHRKGYAKLIVSSGTIVGARTSNSGSEAYMANRADSTLLINGGNVDLSAQLNDFRLIQEGLADETDPLAPILIPITSTITLDSGSLSCRSLNLIYDQENTPATVSGNGIINLNGGTFTLLRFIRTAASSPGQTSFTLNLNGGTLRPAASLTAPSIFLDALADLKTVVKAGGAIINTTNPATPTTAISMTIAEVLEHDPGLGLTPDGGLAKNGPGSLVLSGANTFTGPVTINAGTSTTASRILLANNSGAGLGEITLADSYADIQVNSGRNIANSITISDTGVEKTLLLPAPTPAGFAAATFSGAITINETNIDHFRVRADTEGFLTLSGKISGPGGLFKYQPGTVTLSNATNDFTGGAKITAGGLSFSNGALGTVGSVLMEGGTLTWSPGNSQDISSRIVMVNGKNTTLNLAEQTTPSYAISNVSFASAIGNNSTAALVKIGQGSLDLIQPNTYSGGTTITQGTLNFANGGLGTTGAVSMNGGTLRWLSGSTEDVSGRITMVNAKTAIFSTGGNTVTFANAIGNSSTGNLKKTGSGILALAGTNTYTGTTTVDGGTLLVDGSINTASAVTVTTGDLGGSGTIGGSVSVAAAGNLAPGDSAGTLSITGSLDISAMAAGSGKLKFELGALAGSNDLLAVGGTLPLGPGDLGIENLAITNLGGLQAGTYTLITSTGLSGTVNGTPAEITTGFNGQLQVSGNNLQLVVSVVIANPYTTWSGGAPFDADANNDGVDNGLAWFLGAANKDDNASGLLPETTQAAGALVLDFDCLSATDRGPAIFHVQYSNDLGQLDPWAETAVPGVVGSFTAGTVDFEVTDPGAPGGLLKVVATIPAGEAAVGKLFGRVTGKP